MSVIEDLDELNRLLSIMKFTVKEEKKTESAQIIVIDNFELMLDEIENIEISNDQIDPKELEILKKEFDELFDLLEEDEEEIEDEF